MIHHHDDRNISPYVRAVVTLVVKSFLRGEWESETLQDQSIYWLISPGFVSVWGS